jgi:Xaa-Pro aminopeptidase
MLKLVKPDDAQAPKQAPDAAPTVAAKPATHDTAPPQALLDFMVTRWREPSTKPPPRVRGHERFAGRRRALSALFPGELLVIPTGHEKIRANDTTYRFRPGSDFYYLTGSLEPDCVLVLSPREGPGHVELLFVEPNPGKKDATFFTDRMKGELWVGPRLGVEGSQKRYGIERCLPLEELPPFLEGALPRAGDKVRVLRGLAPVVDAVKKESDPDKELATALSELRLVKDSMELAALKRAIDATKRGFEDVVRSLKRAWSEREVEGVFNLRARVEGNDVGYGTIAASGANACVLHWTRNDGALRRGTLLLLDAGVESAELYTADITRTLPISGKFTKEQREIYGLVLAAQRAAFNAVRPGNDFMEPNKAAMRVLAEGLERLRILTVGAEEALNEEKQFYKRYSLHNVSHMLGLDVHDCAKARAEAYKLGKLRPGMVLTVEPGLYFQTDDLTVPARYRGIGVRIEDDVVVTGKGCRILSDGIPREIETVERWMERLWKSAKA